MTVWKMFYTEMHSEMYLVVGCHNVKFTINNNNSALKKLIWQGQLAALHGTGQKHVLFRHMFELSYIYQLQLLFHPVIRRIKYDNLCKDQGLAHGNHSVSSMTVFGQLIYQGARVEISHLCNPQQFHKLPRYHVSGVFK